VCVCHCFEDSALCCFFDLFVLLFTSCLFVVRLIAIAIAIALFESVRLAIVPTLSFANRLLARLL